MDLLNEFIFLLGRNNQLQQLETRLPTRSDSKTRQLFEAIATRRVANDYEAAQLIYQTSPKDKKYLMLKHKLMSRLAQAVYELNYTERRNDNYHELRVQCRQNLSIAESLLKQNVFHNAERLIKRTLELAKAFHLIDIELEGLKLLRWQSSLNGTTKSIEQLAKEIDRLLAANERLTRAEGFLQLTKARLLHSIARHPQWKADIDQQMLLLASWLKTDDNVFLQHIHRMLDTYACRLGHQAADHLHRVQRYEEFLQQHPFLQTTQNMLFLLHERIRAYLALGLWAETKPSIDQALALSDYRSFDKFETQSLHFEYCLKTAQYTLAGQILAQVRQAPQFALVYEPEKAAWYLRQAYLFWALLHTQNQDLITSYTPDFAEGFTYQDFAQLARAAQKDKLGYNVGLQIISLMLKMHFEWADPEYEAANLKVYFHRHLRHLPEQRTAVFFRWCYQMAANHLVPTERCNLQTLAKQLAQCRGIASGSTEFIPFELMAQWMPLRGA